MNDATALRATWTGERAGVDDELEVVGVTTRRRVLLPAFPSAEPVVGVLTGDADPAVAAVAAEVVAAGAWQPTTASSVECQVSITGAGGDLVTHLPLGPAGAEPTAPDPHQRLSSLLADLARATTSPEAALRFSARPFDDRIVVRLEALGDRPLTVFLDPAAVTLTTADGAPVRSADAEGLSVMAPDGSLLAPAGDPLTLTPGSAGSVALGGLLDDEPPPGAVLRVELQVDLDARGPLAFGATRPAVVQVPLS